MAQSRRQSAALSPALAALLKALSGSRLQIGLMDQDAPASDRPRPVLSAHQLLLPRGLVADSPASPQADILHANPALAKAIAAHASAHLLFSQESRPVTGLKPVGIAVVSVIEDARVEALLCERFPGVARWFRQWAKAPCHQPHGSFADYMTRLACALLDSDYADEDYWISKARRMFAECVRESGLIDYGAFRHLGSVLANDLGQLRVPFNAAEYVVPLPYRDDNSFLWADPNAAQLLLGSPDLRGMQGATPPAQEPSQSVSPDDKTDRGPDVPGTLTVSYPEWDHRSGLLRQGWCKVIESMAGVQQAVDRPSRSGLRPGAQKLRRITAGTLRRRRGQPDGDWLDLDAAIRHVIDRRLAIDPEHRHYVRRDRQAQSVSVLLLLDLSASANDVVDGMGTRLIELSCDAALALAESLASNTVRTAIHGFRSDTRSRIHYERFLDFGTTLDQTARLRLRAATARESTRMGAALRHALRFLSREASERRLLIVLSDGVPSDIDVFDPLYLTRDAARAVQDVRRAGVDVFCITPVPTQALTAREIFGKQNVLRVVNTQALASTLARFVGRRMVV